MYNITDIREQLAQQVYSGEPTEVQKTSGLMSRATKEIMEESPYDPAQAIFSRMQKYKAPTDGVDTRALEEVEYTKPRAKAEGGDTLPISEQASSLISDPAFESKLSEMESKYPNLTRQELFRVVKGESGFDPQAKNPSGASGLFQIMPKVAKELGTTTEAILKMKPAQQLDLYDKYLEKWDYQGNTSLGVMQAAPAYANASPDTVIYKKGSKAWAKNKGWRSKGNGPITVESIDAYYRRQ